MRGEVGAAVKKKARYETEAALCADFIAWVRRENGLVRYGETLPVWTVYAETAGWDILLVAEDGTQIGVEAKLSFNMKVLQQCLPDTWSDWHDRGPDYRAVLVPSWDSDAARVCNALGLALIGSGGGWQNDFRPGLLQNEAGGGWHYWSPGQREKLPEFVPDVAAGMPSPLRLTQWKIAALRIVATLELRGYVTRKDFGTHKIDSRRWCGPSGWLQPGERRGEWVRGPALDFEKQHPEVYQQVLAEIKAGWVDTPRADPDPVQQELAHG